MTGPSPDVTTAPDTLLDHAAYAEAVDDLEVAINDARTRIDKGDVVDLYWLCERVRIICANTNLKEEEIMRHQLPKLLNMVQGLDSLEKSLSRRNLAPAVGPRNYAAAVAAPRRVISAYAARRLK
ncbi:MAG: hypothetical protein WCK65_10285 [Rhodospirillaceae bacterium]